MQAKEYMESVLKAQKELKLINLKRKHFMELATMTSTGGGAVGGKTGNTSRVETAAVNMADLTAELDKKAAEYTAIIQHAMELIDRIPEYKFRQILTLTYVIGMDNPEDIRKEMEYQSDKSVYRVRGFALRELQKLL